MKKLICFVGLMALMLTMSCDESVRFEEAPPVSFKTLKKFPKSLRGRYLSDEGDSVFLVITKKQAMSQTIMDIDMPVDSLIMELKEDEELIYSDSSARGFTITSLEEPGSARVTITEDRAVGEFRLEEVLFNFSKKNALKVMDGIYYISVLQDEETAWVVRRLESKGDELILQKLTQSSGELKLSDFTPTTAHIKETGTQDGVKINPRTDQLESLFKQFGEVTRTYKRIE